MTTVKYDTRKEFKISIEREKWTEREAIVARIFSFDNMRYLQEVLRDTIEEKVNLPYNPESPETFKFTHEFLRGQISLLTYLLANSEEAKENLAPQKDESEL